MKCNNWFFEATVSQLRHISAFNQYSWIISVVGKAFSLYLCSSSLILVYCFPVKEREIISVNFRLCFRIGNSKLFLCSAECVRRQRDGRLCAKYFSICWLHTVSFHNPLFFLLSFFFFIFKQPFKNVKTIP